MYKKLELKKYISIYLCVPFVINFLYNFIKSDYSIPHLDLKNLIVGFASFCLLYSIGKLISISFGLKSISFSMVIYLMSFFVIDFSYLVLQIPGLSFSNTFTFTNIVWLSIIFFKFKSIYLKHYFVMLSSFLFLRLLTNLLDKDLIKGILQGSDVEYFWFPMSRFIYENSLLYALENNIEPGYGLLINYIQAVLHKLTINSTFFEFSPSISNIFIFIFILFIFELNLPNIIKFACSILFISIVFNSDWLSYLLINSLMGEGVVNIFFTIIIYNLFIKRISEYRYVDYICYLIIGFFYLSKPFVSILLLLAILMFSVVQKNIPLLLFGYIGFIVNFTIYRFTINGSYSNNYFNITELSNIFNIESLAYQNILYIISDLIRLDRVMSLFIIFLFFLVIINYIYKKQHPVATFLHIITNANLLLVLVLYISVWQTRELESAYRYVFSILNLYIISLGYELKKFQNL